MQTRSFTRAPWARLLLSFLALALVHQAPTADAQDQNSRRRVLKRTGFLDPQVVAAPDGTVYLLWAKTYGQGFDLFLSAREPGGHLATPRRMNEKAGSVEHSRLDELRPALAAGPKGRVAVGWVDAEANVHAALLDSRSGSLTRWQLNRSEGNPVRGFVELGFDPRGRLHAVWLDARGAKRGEEEPAHLYGARLDDRRARPREINLTGGWTDSVCGCCRPAVRAMKSGIEVLVRNVGPDGYRDIHRGMGNFDDGLESFERVGPATWKIDACPMSGAIAVDGRIYWRDGSTGVSRVVEATALATTLSVVQIEKEPWAMTGSPRRVSGTKRTTLFLPGSPRGRLLLRDGGSWRVLSADIPEWCTSIAAVDGSYLLVGDEHSELRMESLQPED